MDEPTMKVIQAELTVLEALQAAWKDLAPQVLGDVLGRSFNEDGDLINRHQGKNHTTVTSGNWGISNDPVQGYYMIHPDKKRGNWEDTYLDMMVALIPEGAVVNESFTPTPSEVL
jgi:hypothetical protein